MIKRKRSLVIDISLVCLSIVLAFYMSDLGIVESIAAMFSGIRWLGIFTAGLLFTSLFTTAPAIVILGEFAHTSELYELALIGGLGALAGDYILYRLVRDRIKHDLEYLMQLSKTEMLKEVFKARVVRLFTPFIGAAIIASPLPDELGIAMLGLSDIKPKFFGLISFVMNAGGILAIGLVARAGL